MFENLKRSCENFGQASVRYKIIVKILEKTSKYDFKKYILQYIKLHLSQSQLKETLAN